MINYKLALILFVVLVFVQLFIIKTVKESLSFQYTVAKAHSDSQALRALTILAWIIGGVRGLTALYVFICFVHYIWHI